MGPLVSVVIPTRNRVLLLADLLAALEAQSYPHYEVIVVDDASTDGTAEALSSWAQDGRIIVALETPRGSYAARNIGLEKARGEIIAFTDDDCVPDPHWIERLVAALDGEAIGVQGRTLAEPGEITPFTHQIEQTRGGPPYRTCNIAYRRSIVDELGGFDESFRWYADNILGYRARRLGPIRFAADAVVRHPPRPREYRSRAHWRARFDADARHRAILDELGGEPISPPQQALPVLLWVIRPLVKQSHAHLRYLLRHPRAYLQQLPPMLREKQELLAAMRGQGGMAPLSPLPQHPLVSIVIVTRDRPDLLAGTLSALADQTWPHREVIVVNNGGGLPPLVGVTMVEAPEATLGAARQMGVDAASGDIVAFTDDDCLPGPEWLEVIVRSLRDRRLHGVQGRTIAEPGPAGSHAIQVTHANRLYETCNMAYRREAITEAGGFDPAFQGWFEDTALGAAVSQNGALGFSPEAVVVHRAVPRRVYNAATWRALLADEHRLARTHPDFYRRVRGPNVMSAIVMRWLIGAPVKALLREIRRGRSLEEIRELATDLIAERRELVRVLLHSAPDKSGL